MTDNMVHNGALQRLCASVCANGGVEEHSMH